MICFVGVLTLTALPATAQIINYVNWTGGVGAWDSTGNWQFGIIPEAACCDEVGRINNGGTAFVPPTPSTNPGGVLLDPGTLEIRDQGSLTVVAGPTAALGDVVVGQTEMGTLIVERGGSLNAELLSSGGPEASSIVLGTGAAGTANVTVSGTANLARNTRVIGPNVNFTAGTLGLSGTLTAEITDQNHSALQATIATLGGQLALEFNGVTPMTGQTWDIVDAETITGRFASVTSDTALGVGRGFIVQTVPGGTNGMLARVGIDVQMLLSVNRRTGSTHIRNLANEAVTIDGYGITSPAGTLDDTTWLQFTEGGPWSGNSSPTHVAQVSLDGSREIGAGADVDMGNLYAFEPTQLGETLEDMTFEYHVQNGGVVNGLVEFTGPHNNVMLVVDEDEGVFIQNQSEQDLFINGYAIVSESGALNSSVWTSLADSDANWSESNPASNHIAELNLENSRLFAGGGEAVSLGPIFTSGAAKDLMFEYNIAGLGPFMGVVEYDDVMIQPPAGPGDFNGNGEVELGDLNLVLFNWNSGSVPPQWVNQIPTDMVGLGELNAVLFNWGNMALAATVPEPTSLVLVMMGCLLTAQWVGTRCR